MIFMLGALLFEEAPSVSHPTHWHLSVILSLMLHRCSLSLYPSTIYDDDDDVIIIFTVMSSPRSGWLRLLAAEFRPDDAKVLEAVRQLLADSSRRAVNGLQIRLILLSGLGL